MKMNYRKLLSLLLCLALLLGCAAVSALAAENDAPTRVVCTFYGDSGTTRAFHWYTQTASASEVKIDGKIYTGEKAVKFQGSYAHAAVVDGLNPGKTYVYQVGDGKTNSWSAEGKFTTNQGSGQPSGFVALTDVQAGTEEDYAKSAKLLGRAWKLLDNSKGFYVHLGDYTNNSDNKEYDFYFSAFAPYVNKMTHAPVSGNHDGPLKLKFNWFKNMFTLKEQPGSANFYGTYYSFDDGDAHYAVLNTNESFPMSAQQINWLQNDMNASAAKWKIVFLHKSPYSAGQHPNDPDIITQRRQLIPVFDALGIDLVMSGHDHMYYRSEPAVAGKIVGAQTAKTTSGAPIVGSSRSTLVSSYKNPKGPIYILPNTGGFKEYTLGKKLPSVVKDVAVQLFQPGQPVYTTVSINGGELTYNAYMYHESTDEDILFDQMTITKTQFTKPDPNQKPLPTGFLSTLPSNIWTFFCSSLLLLPEYVKVVLGA